MLVPATIATYREAPAKLTDFGGARLAGEDALTRTGDVLGTLAYMAPEQSEGREVGEPADLYSLALVLYEGLTRRQPGARTPRPPPPPGASGVRCRRWPARRRDLPRTLASALDRALAVDPDRRGTLDELCVILEQVAGAGSDTQARPVRRADRAGALPAAHGGSAAARGRA